MLKIIRYDESHMEEWDGFLNLSINGTFLQSRNFLNYHKKDKFLDHSILVYNENELITVVPACEIISDEIKVLVSHAGSTFGGLIILGKYYKLLNIIEIVNEVVEYYKKYGFSRIIFKMTADIFIKQNTDLIQYILRLNGFNEYTELSTYVDTLSLESDDIINRFSQRQKRNLKRANSNNLMFKQLYTNDEIAIFYKLLSSNLLKFNTTPVHTLDELFDFKNKRLVDYINFFGVYKEDEQIAGTMAFNINNVLHTQYLAADQEKLEFSPMTFLYYNLIQYSIEKKFNKLSWGIATEDKGKTLNEGLAVFKESVGSNFSLNRTFYIDL